MTFDVRVGFGHPCTDFATPGLILAPPSQFGHPLAILPTRSLSYNCRSNNERTPTPFQSCSIASGLSNFIRGRPMIAVPDESDGWVGLGCSPRALDSRIAAIGAKLIFLEVRAGRHSSYMRRSVPKCSV